MLLPRGQMPLNIFEPRYLAMVDHAIRNDRLIGMIQPNPDRAETAPLFTVGCAGRITQFAETGDGRYLITLTGVARFRLLREKAVDTPFLQYDVDWSLRLGFRGALRRGPGGPGVGAEGAQGFRRGEFRPCRLG